MVAVGIVGGVAGCGGGGDGGNTTTEDPDSPGSGGDRSPIEASVDELKLAAAALPDGEDWELAEQDEDSTKFERMVDVHDYRIEAQVLETESVEAAVSTFEEERERANSYTGVEVDDVELASAAFGYQLTSNEGTVVFRNVNVVGEVLYGLAEHEFGRNVDIALESVVDYASMWQDSWR